MQQHSFFSMNRQQNILKATIPFLPNPKMKSLLSNYIRMSELQGLMQEFPPIFPNDLEICQSEATQTEFNKEDLLKAVSPFLKPSELEFINAYRKMMDSMEEPDPNDTCDFHTSNASDSSDSKQTTSNQSPEQILSMLSPEQKRMFQQYANLLGIHLS